MNTLNQDNADLEYAKKALTENKLTFVIVNDKKIIAKSAERGVAPFFSAVHLKVQGASVADKIVGKAVAFLSVYADIAAVYSPVMSQPAYNLLREHDIYAEADTTVPMIMNRNKNGQCPIEKLIWDCNSPKEAYKVLKKKFKE